ncbi:MAG: phosphatidylserine decarboxylase [Betaproteobacteria bacterium]|jgi:phosphatidylserine decarboxylase|nr:phosphatidylserine decarboxylase [Betaproteobacteria bacterium]NBP44890.1 phosphatidylserine decarboxylase [Betaproteobacteria bacterium]
MAPQPLPQHPLIAREGWPFIALAVAAALVVNVTLGWVWALPFDLIAIFVLQFFRDPARPDLAGEGDVLSPADGRIVKVEKAIDPYTNQEALLISVFMNVFNVHSNRASVAGRVKHVAYFPGQFLNADLDKASTHNERNLVVIETQCRGQTYNISLVQVAGLIARRILCYVKPGDDLLRAQRYGFIRFGSRVDVYLPLSAKPCVAAGEKVHAATTILAQL